MVKPIIMLILWQMNWLGVALLKPKDRYMLSVCVHPKAMNIMESIQIIARKKNGVNNIS